MELRKNDSADVNVSTSVVKSDITEMGRRIFGALSVLSLVQLAVPWAAFSEELHLGSGEATHTVDQNFAGTVNLTVNGETKTVGAGAQLTGAEYATFLNAIGGQAQTLTIGQGGVATGGYVNLTPQLAQTITGLVVPTNVSLLHNVGELQTLNLTGNLTNSGNYFAFSTNNAITNGIINASNLYNNQNALLTSVLPSTGLPGGITGAISNLSLTLNIVNNLFNAGSITSAGNLNINAGAIYNQLPAGVTGASPIMQAVNNLNLNATLGNITNSGTMAAVMGNVNLASVNNMVINNVNGSIQALMGNINVRDAAFDAAKNLDILGGKFVSQQLNLYSGKGNIDVDILGASGVLNADACAIHVTTAETLNLGAMNLTGDPGFIVTRGDLNILVDQVFAGQNLALVAAGNVRTVNPNLQISAGNVFVSAGGFVRDFGGGDGSIRDLESFRTQGGNIDFSTNPLGAPLSATGNMTLVTLGGQNNAGTIAVPTQITGTNVLIIADAQPGNVNNYASIVLGGGVDATGTVTIAAAKPNYTTPGSTVNPILGINSDAINPANITVGALRNSSIEIFGGVQSGGGNIDLQSGNQITITGPLTSTGPVGGNINVAVNSAVTFTAGGLAGGQRNGVGGVIAANGTNGAGGAMTIANAGTGGITVTAGSDVQATGTNGNGGSISLTATNGDLTFVNDGLLQANSTTNNGGTITLNAQRIVSPVPINLFANGQVNGGAVSVSQTLDGRALNVTAGNIGANVSGATGSAGVVTFNSAGDLTFDQAQVTGTAGNGTGVTVNLSTTGTNPLSNLLVLGSLASVGIGAGTGGTISINSGGAREFTIGQGMGTVNGVQGVLSSVAAGTGAGGSVVVSAARSLTVTGALNIINANSLGGPGGTISLTARGTNNGSFGLQVDPGALNVSAGNGAGGSITLNSTAAPLNVLSVGTFNANAAGTGGGGSININAHSFTGANFALSANAAGTGAGGSVNVTTSSRVFSWAAGAGGNNIVAISVAPAGVGAGGSVTLSSGANLTVTTAGITAAPTDGNGAQLNFAAGTQNAAGGPGTLSIIGSIIADGVGANRSGGSVTLASNSAQAFTFGVVPGDNGLTGGSISVTGNGTGSGGSISINNLGSGGISVAPANLGLAAGATGSRVTLTATNGPVTLAAGTYSVDAGASQGAGGSFTVNTRDIVLPGVTSISANGSVAGGGAGGSISLVETGDVATAQFNVDAGLTLSANAGAGGAGGGGGSITVSVPRALFVDPTFATVSNAVTGGGGTLNFTAGTAARSNLTVGGPINLDGVNNSAGGSLTLTSSGNVSVQGAVQAMGNGTGQGGQVFITANGDTPFSIVGGITGNSVNSVNVSSPGGSGGRLSIINPLGITISDLTLINLTAGSGSGGTLTLTASNGAISIDTAAQNFINLNGTAGSGGQFSLTASAFNITNGMASGTVDLQAAGAGGGGGTFNIASTGAIADLSVQAGGQFIISGSGTSIAPVNFNPMVTAVPAGQTTLVFSSVTGLAAGQAVTLLQNNPANQGGPITVLAIISAVDGGTNTVTFSTPLPPAPSVPGGTTAFLGNNVLVVLSVSPSSTGQVTLSSGRNLTVNMANVQVAPSGDGAGASYSFTSGSSGATGNMLVTGTINAAAFAGSATPFGGGSVTLNSNGLLRVVGDIVTSSVSAGAGNSSVSGSITLVSNSNQVFTVDNANALATNGVFGVLNLQEQTPVAGESNTPGSVTITNNGVGGINIANTNTHVLQTALNANGASFTANAGLGTFSVAQTGTLSVDGNGTLIGGGITSGGTIAINAASFAPAGHLSLLARGGTGQGGSVTVNATGASSFIEIHKTNVGAIDIDSSSGGSGNGGIINVTAGTRLLIDPTNDALKNQTGGGGTGQNMTFTATGQAGGCCGSVLFTAPVNFSGQTTGVVINVNSVTPFTIGNPGTSGNGIVSVGGIAVNMDGIDGGAGGTFSINQTGAGGVVISNGTTLQARAGVPSFPFPPFGDGNTPFRGGNISIGTGSGGLKFGNGLIDVGVLSSLASGSPQARGGTITINTNQLVTNAGATGAMVLNAIGGIHGQGGSVTLTTTNGSVLGGTNNLVLGAAAGQFNVDARGGAVGGTLSFTSGGNLTVTAANAQFGAIDPLLNFDGGQVSLSASGNVVWNGNLDAGGRNIGDGGSVTIRHNGFSTFAIGSAFGAGITGTLNTSAGLIAGNGGTIDLATTNSFISVPGGFVFDANANSTNYAVAPVLLPPGTNANRGGIAGVATGPVSGIFNGGRVTIQTSFISVSTAGNVTMQANGAGQGNGGTVQFTQTNAFPIQAGGVGNVYNFTATGGSVNSIGGNGGTINLTSPGGVNLQSLPSFNAGPLGALGNGASYLLNGGAFGAVTVAFALNASGTSSVANALANGGAITITQNIGAFSIGAGTVGPGVAGNVTADSGNFGGTGGTINLALGTSGVTLRGASTVAARGRNISGGSGLNSNGGTINLNSGAITNLNPGVAIFVASGGNASNGGTINVTTSGPLVVGSAAGQSQFSVAAGTPGNAARANGGTLNLTAQFITIADPASGLTVSPAGLFGNGGTMNLSATTTGIITVIGGLTANGGAMAGNGGTISLITNTGAPLQVNTGTTLFNGLSGNLSVAAGAVQGNGGTILLRNTVAGGINVGAAATLNGSNANLFGDTSGSITFDAVNGPLTIGTATISAAPAVGNGGTISLTGSTITGPAGVALVLNASGGLGGNGGTVAVRTTLGNTNASNLTIGNAAGNITVLAAGGLLSNGQTTGGTANLESAGLQFTVNPAFLNVSTSNANGNAGTVRLTAAPQTGTSGSLQISNNLNLNGVGIGNGGTVVIRARGVFNFVLGANTTNGVNGTVSVDGGVNGGNAGSIDIDQTSVNSGGGIVFATASPLTAAATQGNPGSIKVVANGFLPIQFNGNTILNVNALSGNRNGGTIELGAARYVYGVGAAASLTANASGTGSGGTVTVRGTGIPGTSADVLINNVAGSISIAAQGGTLGLAGGDGGTVILSSASPTNSLTINPLALAFGTRSETGNGGSLTATSGLNLFFTGNLNADSGTLAGNGGTLNLTSGATFPPFGIGVGTTVNGVNGLITANAVGLVGNGGTVNVTNTTTAGITLTVANSISANSGTFTGNGGTIGLTATNNGTINLGTGAVALSVDGSGQGNGGTLTLNSSILSLTAGTNHALQSRGGVSGGQGGTINVTVTSAGSPLNIGSALGSLALAINSNGAGRSGTINVSTSANLNVNSNGLFLLGAAGNGVGATVNLTSGASGGFGNLVTTGIFNVGFGTNASLNLTGPVITQTALGSYQGKAVTLVTPGALGTALAPIQVSVGVDPTGGLQARSTSFGSVFVNQTGGAMALGASSAGFQFNLTGDGDINVIGALSGANLSQINLTTANLSNGAINIRADVGGSAFGTTNINANGSGAITNNAGVFRTGTLNLTSSTGSIGTSASRVITTATTISANTGGVGSVFIFAAASPTTPGGFAPTVNINASSASLFDYLACGSVNFVGNVTAPILQLGTFSGDITAVGTSLNNVTTIGITAANNATISKGNGNLNLARTSVTNSLSVTASGVLTINGPVTGNNLTFASNGAGGGIVINGDITGTNPTPTINSQVTFSSFTGNSLTRTGGAAVTANTVNFSMGSGAVGTNVASIQTDANFINNSGFGATNNVFIQEINGVQLGTFGFLSAGGTFNLTVNDGQTTFQSINAGGLISIVKQGNVGSLTQLAGGFTSNLGGGITLTTPGNSPIILNGTISAGGTGNVNITGVGAGASVSLGNVSANNGTLGVTSVALGITQTAFTNISTNNGDISLTGVGGNVLLNGTVRTNSSGNISITSVPGSVVTNSVSTGFTGPNGITITGLGAGGVTVNPNSFVSAGANGNLQIVAPNLNGTITLTNATVSTSGTGTMTITAQGTVTLGTLSTGSGVLNVTSFGAGGSIVGSGFFSSVSSSSGAVTISQVGGGAGGVNLTGDVSTLITGNINITGLGAAGVSVRNVRTGFTGPNNTITITATTGASPITQAAFTTISTGTGGSISLTGGGLVSLQSITSSGALTVTSLTGGITQGASTNVSGSTVNYSATNGAAGNITTNGMVRSNAGNLTIFAGNSVTVNSSLTSTGGQLSVTANSGTLTSNASGFMSASGGDLVLTTLNGATGNITLGAGLTVNNDPAAVRNLTVSAARSASVNSLFNFDPTGDITVQATTGLLTMNAFVSGQGNLSIIHTGGASAGDAIVISPFVSLFALAPSAPQGNIVIALLNGAPLAQVAGVPPLGGTTSQITSGGGQIFFGPQQFVNTGFTTLNAKGANITFFNNKSAGVINTGIQTNSNFIFADPPVGGSPMAVPSVVPVSTPSSSLGANPGARASSPLLNAGQPAATQTVPSPTQLQMPAQVQGLVDIFRPFFVSPTPATATPVDTTPMQNVPATTSTPDVITQMRDAGGAMVQSAVANVNSVLTGFVTKKSGAIGGASSYMRPSQHAVVNQLGDSSFELKHGEVIVSANRRSTVTSGEHTVDAAPGSIVHVTREGDVLKVRNLCDSVGKAVRVLVAGKSMPVNVGEEVVIGISDGAVNSAIKGDNIGRRKVSRFVVDGRHSIVKSELSVIALIQKSNLLTSMYTKGSAADRNVMERIMKMAAALFQVTGKRGAYSAYDPSKVDAPVPLSSVSGDETVKVAQSR